jgi:hypothetical protein
MGVAESYLITMFSLLGIFLLLFLKVKSENKRIKKIGDIEFTKSGIIKQIGDSTTEIKYASIRSVDLQKHIPALTINDGKSGYFTFILTIHFKDSQKEALIVSDRPSGKWQDLSITETIKTLNKLYFCHNMINLTKP